MLKHLLNFFFPFLMLSFAAADVSLGAGDGAAAADAGAGDAGTGADDAGDDYGLGDDAGADEAGAGQDDDAARGDDHAEDHADKDKHEEADKETVDLKGAVSRRLQAFAKKSPAIAQLLKDPANKEFTDFVEATARRDMAYRELYPTVAEARQMREQFPGGMSDVEQLLTDVKEVETLDQNFYTKDREGNYSGHRTIIDNLFSDDREAAVSLFRTVPKEWARLDPDSYREVMGQIVGATLARAEIPEVIGEMIEAAKEAKQDGLAKQLNKVLNWMGGFLKEKSAPTEEERRIQSDRAQFNRERQDRQKEDRNRFAQTFVRESRKLQVDVIGKHPAIKALEKAPGITPEKRSRIQELVRGRIEKYLAASPSFMRKLRAEHSAGNLKGTLDLQKVQWQYPWILNKFVREVLREETPAMVRQNRETVRRRTEPVKTTRNSGERREEKRTAPYQEGGRWFSKEGKPYSTADILRGKHLAT